MDKIDQIGQAGIKVTAAMVRAAIDCYYQFVPEEDLVDEWMPVILAAALATRQQFDDAGKAAFR